MLRFILLAGTAAASPQLASAQTTRGAPAAPAASAAAPQARGDYHADDETIVVTGNFLRELDVLSGSSVLGSPASRRRRSAPAPPGPSCAASRASASAC